MEKGAKSTRKKFRAWCVKGQFHRIDGPAIEPVHGKKDWYIQNKPFKGPKK